MLSLDSQAVAKRLIYKYSSVDKLYIYEVGVDWNISYPHVKRCLKIAARCKRICSLLQKNGAAYRRAPAPMIPSNTPDAQGTGYFW
jgi:hypothetical protein